MKKNIQGFTVVELLIVIVVIGILASISLVSYSGFVQRARNVQTITAAKAWSEAMEIYVAKKGDSIKINMSPICLGGPEDYPKTDEFDEGDCVGSWTKYQTASSLEFSDALAAYGGIPNIRWDFGVTSDPWWGERARGVRFSERGIYPTTNSQEITYSLYGNVDCEIVGAVKQASADTTSCELPVDLYVDTN